MIAADTDLARRTLADPRWLSGATAMDWSRLIAQARSAGVLGRIAYQLASQPDIAVPPEAQVHLQSALRVSAAQRKEVEREVRHVTRALAVSDTAVVLLKGAAYAVADLPAADGRIFSDIDLLVPKRDLPAVEALLALAGWTTTHHDAYDQRYYREWMHELPPLEHSIRRTVLDVHHTILPETARLRPDAALLLSAAEPLPQQPRLRVLAPPDMVLHSMTHLFMNEEMSHALRDLADLDALVRHFEALPGFWPRLLERAARLDLGRPLYYGLTHLVRCFATPVPPDTLAASRRHAPPWPLRAMMEWIWRRALRTPHPSAGLRGQSLALFALYVRGHWLRMPPLLLIRHLSIKAWRRWKEGQPDPDLGPRR